MKAEFIVQRLLDSEDLLRDVAMGAVDPLYRLTEAAETGKPFELIRSHEDQHGVKHEFRIRLGASPTLPQLGVRSLDVRMNTVGGLSNRNFGGWIIFNIKKDPNTLPGILQLLRKMFDAWHKFKHWEYSELCNSFLAFNTYTGRRKRRLRGVRRYD